MRRVLKDMFRDKKMDEAFAALPRQLPKKEEVSPEHFLYTREFMSGQERFYFGATDQVDEEIFNGVAVWAVSKYSSVIDRKGNVHFSHALMKLCNNLEETVHMLNDFELDARSKGASELKGSLANYYASAQSCGLHVDDVGRLVAVVPNQPIVVDTIIGQRGLKLLYNGQAEDTSKAFSSWQDVQTQLLDKVLSMPLAENSEVLQNDPGFQRTLRELSRSGLLRDLEDLPEFLLDPKFNLDQKKAAIVKSKTLVDVGLAGGHYLFRDADTESFAELLCYSTLLQGLLKAGARVYRASEDTLLSDTKTQEVLSLIGDNCRNIAHLYLGVDDFKKAETVKDIILKDVPDNMDYLLSPYLTKKEKPSAPRADPPKL